MLMETIEILNLIGYYGVIYSLIKLFFPNVLPNSLKEFFWGLFNASPKAWRIIYPLVILLGIYEPKDWWKVTLMIVTLEIYALIAKPTVDWVFRKFGY